MNLSFVREYFFQCQQIDNLTLGLANLIFF